ncbi:E3 ubiquitin-protein ligase Praja-1-like [Polypterus senegalus]|uniref:E3 ubiquitin-protein ligase Praja-1-like n=1 Tax=Polypterus senegalus TaxID=55291 RepID=UPI0019636D8D|nr:E3 ubiquitin-protein ligase Praja-1-like [Polypterus senegalus]
MSNPAKMRRLHSPSEQQSLERSNDCEVENQGDLENKKSSSNVQRKSYQEKNEGSEENTTSDISAANPAGQNSHVLPRKKPGSAGYNTRNDGVKKRCIITRQVKSYQNLNVATQIVTEETTPGQENSKTDDEASHSSKNQGQKNKRTSTQIKHHALGKIDQLPGSSALEKKDKGVKKCESEDNGSRDNEDHEEPTEEISVVQTPKDAEVCDSEIPVELNETQQDQRALVIRGRNINNDLSFSEEQHHHQTILSFHITVDWTALEGFYFTIQEQSGSILHLPSDTTLAMIRWHLSTRTLQEEMMLMQSRINIITDVQTSNHGVPRGVIITIGVHHFYMRLTNQLQEGLFYHFLQIFSRGQHASFSTRTFENTRSLSTCTVCLAAYIRGDLIRSLPCYHEFHANCIDRWLHRNSTCPVCRRTVFRSLQY